MTREQALFEAVWMLINEIDAIVEIAAGHPAYRIDLTTAIERASHAAESCCNEFPAENEWVDWRPAHDLQQSNKV